jgi:hypothetical protein
LTEVSEAAAAVLLPYFLEGRAKSGLSSRVKHIPASMPKFPAAVQWLLQSFATEAVIAVSYQKLFTARQSVEEDEKQFAGRLTQYAAEAESVFYEDALISAFVDGLQPYASNTVRGQVTTTMTFAEIQLVAEQTGTASRALTSLTKASPRLGNPGFNSLRSHPVVAATAESYQRDSEMYSDRSPMMPYPQELLAQAEYLHDAEVRSDHSGENSISSFPSSISAPTRDWVSAAGSQYSLQIPKDAVNAVEYRGRSCRLCFKPTHLLMDCPLLGTEIRQMAQQQRDHKSREPPVRREFTAFPRSFTRPPISPRLVEPRTAPVVDNPVID